MDIWEIGLALDRDRSRAPVAIMYFALFYTNFLAS